MEIRRNRSVERSNRSGPTENALAILSVLVLQEDSSYPGSFAQFLLQHQSQDQPFQLLGAYAGSVSLLSADSCWLNPHISAR